MTYFCPKCEQQREQGCFRRQCPGIPATGTETEQRIDAALESVLNAAGTSLRHYTLPDSREKLREAMRQVMSASYIAGSNDAHESFRQMKLRK